MSLSYNYAVVDMRRAQNRLLEQIIKVASANGGYVWFTNNDVVQKEEEEKEEKQSLFKEDRALSDRPATSTASQSSVVDDEKVKLDLDPPTVSYASSTDEEKVKLDMDPASVSSYASSTDCNCEACAKAGDSELVTRLGAIADAMFRAFDRKMGEEEKEKNEEEQQVSCSVVSSSEKQSSLDSETDLNTARSAASFFEKNDKTVCSNASSGKKRKDQDQSITFRRQPTRTATEPYAYIGDDGRIVCVAATSTISKLLTSQRALLSTLDTYNHPTGDFAVLEAAIRSVCNDINVLIKRDYKSTSTDNC